MFLLRRIIFTFLILFGTQIPFLTVLSLVGLCLVTLSFTLVEKQWQDSLISYQHIFNETCLYLMLILLALFTGPPIGAQLGSLLGWWMIVLVILTCIVNIVIILYYAIKFLKIWFRNAYIQRNLYKLRLIRFRSWVVAPIQEKLKRHRESLKAAKKAEEIKVEEQKKKEDEKEIGVLRPTEECLIVAASTEENNNDLENNYDSLLMNPNIVVQNEAKS